MRCPQAILLISVALVLGACSKGAAPTAAQPNRPKDLVISDIKVGTGKAASLGETVMVHYKGWLNDAAKTVFDENGPDKDPLTFVVGGGQVIPGWEKGIMGMKEGGKRHLLIPARLAYGTQGKGKIPPDADLNFDIDLVRVISPEDQNTIHVKIVKPGKGSPCKTGQNITMTYSAESADGTPVHSEETASFTLGNDQLIHPGLEDAIIGMKVGESRDLTVPGSLGIPSPASMKPGMSLQIIHIKLISINSKH